MQKNVAIPCGWGRILIASTFDDPKDIVKELEREAVGKRDIAFYVHNPHVVLSYAPQKLFLDPSDTFRLNLHAYQNLDTPPGTRIRSIESQSDAEAINTLYANCGMVPSDTSFIWDHRNSKKLVYFVAEDETTHAIVGTVMGIDHDAAFDCPKKSASLWCLAVNAQTARPGVGMALVNKVATHFKSQGFSELDLSVIHKNAQAKALYTKMGFEQIQNFALKIKNAHNEALFIGPEIEHKLNPYAEIIVDEARARGIAVEILDADEGYFRLSRGGKTVTCRESLSELTSSVAMSRCQDKYVTNRWLRKVGLKTPEFQLAGEAADNRAFLEKHHAVVVKPSTGEQGKGISVGVTQPEALVDAIAKAYGFSDRVLLESLHPGEDLRIVVINYEVVAAAVRKPAQIIGDGTSTARDLIEKQSRRRAAATQGESTIPVDKETEKCLAEADLTLEDLVPKNKIVRVRKTANLHTGGTIHDVTGILHPRLVDAATKAARHLEIPVVGLDMMIKAPTSPDYVIIEANERVGLANHEPQPTAQKFIDLLFPLSAKSAHRNQAMSKTL